MDYFNLNKNNASYYIKYDKKRAFTISTQSIEVENVEMLIQAILKEFDHSSEEEKANYQLLLRQWLTEAEEQELFSSDQALLEKDRDEVLDNTYEMF